MVGDTDGTVEIEVSHGDGAREDAVEVIEAVGVVVEVGKGIFPARLLAEEVVGAEHLNRREHPHKHPGIAQGVTVLRHDA
jgi:hypothetical protein